MRFQVFRTPDSKLVGLLTSRGMRAFALAFVMVLVVAIAAAALRHILEETSWAEIRDAIEQIGTPRLLASLALTIVSYLVLTGYDVLSLRVISRTVPYPRTALASFTSYIFSHNLGFAALTGGTARLRVYRPAGLTFGEIAQIMALAGITFWLGVFLLLAIGLIAYPGAFSVEGLDISYPMQAAAGAAILLALAGYLVLLHFRQGKPMRLFGWTLVLPSVRVALAQFALAAVDLCLATAALLVLLPGVSPAEFPQVLLSYLVAFVSGLITHAPGGVGVFEVVMLVALPQIDRAALFGALVVYRVIYYLLPLAVGMLLFAGHELLLWRRRPAALEPRPVAS